MTKTKSKMPAKINTELGAWGEENILKWSSDAHFSQVDIIL